MRTSAFNHLTRVQLRAARAPAHHQHEGAEATALRLDDRRECSRPDAGPNIEGRDSSNQPTGRSAESRRWGRPGHAVRGEKLNNSVLQQVQQHIDQLTGDAPCRTAQRPHDVAGRDVRPSASSGTSAAAGRQGSGASRSRHSTAAEAWARVRSSPDTSSIDRADRSRRRSSSTSSPAQRLNCAEQHVTLRGRRYRQNIAQYISSMTFAASMRSTSRRAGSASASRHSHSSSLEDRARAKQSSRRTEESAFGEELARPPAPGREGAASSGAPAFFDQHVHDGLGAPLSASGSGV